MTTLAEDQKLRKELLLSALSYLQDPAKALSAACRMERFVAVGQEAPDCGRTDSVAGQSRRLPENPTSAVQVFDGPVLSRDDIAAENAQVGLGTAEARDGAGKACGQGPAVNGSDPEAEEAIVPTDTEAAENTSEEACDSDRLEVGEGLPGDRSSVERPCLGQLSPDGESLAPDDDLGAPVQISAPLDPALSDVAQEGNAIEFGIQEPADKRNPRRPQPSSVQSTIGQIVDFLRARDFSVERLDDGRYRLDGDEVLSPGGLVQRANDQRSFLGKPQFEVDLPIGEAL